MRHDDFCKALNDSPWRCWVNEIGFGVPFQADFLMEPGASNTIISTASLYDKAVQNLGDTRSVSREGAIALANRMIDDGSKLVPIGGAGYEKVFSLSVTGSHKSKDERGDCHAWICLLPVVDGVKAEPYVVHVTLDKHTYTTRKECGGVIANLCEDLINSVLLGVFQEHIDVPILDAFIQDYQHNYNDIYIDVIEGPGMFLERKISLAGINSPIIIRDGHLVRVTDVLRKNPVIYRGSFNPPTASHITIGGDAIYEICMTNARKDCISPEDLVHRVQMLNNLGKDVMITFDVPLFESFHGMLDILFGQDKITYVVGLDTFNAVVDPVWYDDADKALSSFEENGSGHFNVVKRDDLEVNKTQIENRMSYDIVDPGEYDVTASSTRARAGELSVCHEDTARYIEEHGLYR